MVGAELRLHQRERLLQERQRTVELTGRPVAEGEVVHADVSVSGWSGPSFAFFSASVSSKSGSARLSLPADSVAHCQGCSMLMSVSGWSGPSFDF